MNKKRISVIYGSRFAIHVLQFTFFVTLLMSGLSTVFAKTAKETLTVWAMGAEGRKIPEMAQLFEQENPDVKVITQAIPWGAAHEKLMTAVIGGVPPDVSQLGTTWMAEFNAMNSLTQLDKYAESSNFISKNKFFAGSWSTNVIEKKLYGIPWYVDTRVLFYRKDLLKQVGYDHPPRTWDELIKIGKKLTKDTNGDGKIDKWGINLPSGGGGVWTELGLFVWQNDANFLTSDNRYAAAGTDCFREAFKFYVDIFKKEKIAPITTGADINLFQAFKTGYYAMFISGPWMVELVEKECPEIKGKWDVSVLWKRKKQTSFVGGCNLVVFNKSKHKETAWKFIEFMSRPENQIKWYKLTADLPSLRAAWGDPFFDNKPMVKVFGQQLEDAASPPNIPEWEEITHIIGQKVESVTWGGENEDKMLKEIISGINTVLERKHSKSYNSTLFFSIFSTVVVICAILFLLWKKGSNSNVDKLSYTPYIFIFPATIILLIFLFIPIITSFLLSLSNCDVNSITDWRKISFVGFTNYISLFSDDVFWKSLRNTAIFVGVGVPISIVISLFMAIVLNETFVKFKSFFRACYFIPVITTLVAVAVIWKWLYNPDYGIINWFLGLLGISPKNWLMDTKLALPSLIAMAIWKGFGYNMVIFLAGLQAIPLSLYESAKVDGADRWQSFWYITVPGLKPTTLFITITTLIGYFQFFDEPYVMTQGGPLNSTVSIVLHMYYRGFKFFQFGYASAIAYVLFAIIFSFTMLQLKLQKEE
ncbi:MAG: extracellular solute-binding protein [Elusimicrobiota bacterium]